MSEGKIKQRGNLQRIRTGQNSRQITSKEQPKPRFQQNQLLMPSLSLIKKADEVGEEIETKPLKSFEKKRAEKIVNHMKD